MGRRIVLLLVLCALALVPDADGQTGSERLAPGEQYWLGPYFAGLELTDTDYGFAYGECELPEGEGGCSPPVRVQNATTCTRNPIGSNGLVRGAFLMRGEGLAVEYAPGAVDVGTGRQTVSVRVSEPELLGAALREVRRRSEATPEPLFAPPVYPLPVLRELKRVTVAAERFGGVAAIAKATELPPDEVKVRLQIAELLGPDTLAGVPAPTMTVATVERRRQLAYGVQTHDLAHTAERHKISVASLRKQVRSVRGLTGDCG